MGLALDEPRDGDERYEVNDVSVVVDPFAMRVITQSGGLAIKSGIFGPLAELQGAQTTECGC
ncbi:MAG: hypothetical protein FJY85_13840 [Deltaproteobacteria bacterium]|nr:hypothetical protein [Deltaproteobacteria bacterium]